MASGLIAAVSNAFGLYGEAACVSSDACAAFASKKRCERCCVCCVGFPFVAYRVETSLKQD
jgi:hypothetical protein